MDRMRSARGFAGGSDCARGVASSGFAGLGSVVVDEDEDAVVDEGSLWRFDRWKKLAVGVVGRRVVVVLVAGWIWKNGVFRTLRAVRRAERENI